MVSKESLSFSVYLNEASDRSKDLFIQVRHPYSEIISTL